jgi:CTP:molybdopterin cytidylyltransferase MocA
MQPDNIAAIVLAAGFCRRMGSFKPLLDLDGRPVIYYAVESLRKAEIKLIHVIIGHNGDTLLPVLEKLKVHAVVNEKYAEGMFSSVLAGMDSLEPGVKAFFILPADMPLIRPETISSLIRASGQHPGIIVVPSYRGRKGHPPLIPVEKADYIREYRGENGLSGALWSLKGQTAFIPVEDENTVFDFDTAERYEELKERWQRLKSEVHINV